MHPSNHSKKCTLTYKQKLNLKNKIIMAKKDKAKQEPSKNQKQYDKIFKENIEPLVLPIANKLFKLGLSDDDLEEIPDSLQYTLEREPDFLKIVKAKNGKPSYILHIEFEVKDNKEMIYRMAIYYALLLRQYKLNVKQYVFFIGNKKEPIMPNQMAYEKFDFEFNLLGFQQIPYQVFIDSDKPEEWILAILSDFGDDSAEFVAEKILNKLKQADMETLTRSKFVRQLEVMSHIRNLQNIILNKIETMPFIYDIESDKRFLQGESRGLQKGMQQGMQKGMQQGMQKGTLRKTIKTIVRMLKRGLFSHEQIAIALEVELDYVSKMQEALENKKKRLKLKQELLEQELFSKEEFDEMFEEENSGSN
jgi:hypothetical protein